MFLHHLNGLLAFAVAACVRNHRQAHQLLQPGGFPELAHVANGVAFAMSDKAKEGFSPDSTRIGCAMPCFGSVFPFPRYACNRDLAVEQLSCLLFQTVQVEGQWR